MVDKKNIIILGAAFSIGYLAGELTGKPKLAAFDGKKEYTSKALVHSLSYYYMNDDEFRKEFDNNSYTPNANNERLSIIKMGLRVVFRVKSGRPILTLDEVKDALTLGKYA